jgi:hypothetical protein
MVGPNNQLAPEARSLVIEPSSIRGFQRGYVLVEKMNVACKVLDVMGRRISLSKLNSPHLGRVTIYNASLAKHDFRKPG